MVGLKTFWITISALFLLGACVPQTKQSSCAENEAFNASLRTCVPVIGGPSSFVDVDDFVPSSVVTKSKDDYTDVYFSITVSNPYNQAYSIIWERTFNGSPVTLTPVDASALSVKVIPASLGTALNEIGTHIITAKIFVGSTLVDSQNFTMVIQNNPTPVIDTLSVTPDPYAGTTFTPADGIQPFNFTVFNNHVGLDPLHNWKTTWTVVKNNVNYATEIDAFTNFGQSDSNYAEYLFDPTAAGIGNYTVRAVVSTNPPAPLVSAVVDERLWIVTVKNPDFGVVAAANHPLPSVQSVAFHNVSYDVWGFRASVSAASTKAQYCVQVSKPEGAYTDGSAQDALSQGVAIKFYKDSGSSPIFIGTTTSTPLKNTVCFSEASAAEQANLFYADGSSTTPYYKTLTARAFDAQTGLELCVDGTACPVTYPISWSVLVRPTNTPATARILNSVAGDLITYSSAPTASTISSNATVTQDTNFKVRFSLADLAGEYDTATDLDKFKYTAVLKRGSTTITGTGCNKDFTDINPALNAVPQDNVGAVYECQFNIASSDASGPIAPGAHTLTIQAEDSGSPVPGSSGVLANLLTWNLTVLESNTAPSIALANILDATNTPVATPSEGTTIKFQFTIADFEADNYNLVVYKCTDITCATVSSFTGNSVALGFGSTQYNNNYSIAYTIPENEIGNVASGTVYFKAIISDSPNTPAIALASSLVVPVSVTQYNPAPVINVAGLTSPAVNNVTAYNAYSSYKFNISTAGAVSDGSASGSGENTLTYQWWIKESVAGAWTQITGATNAQLYWTPGPEILTTKKYHITFCVTDGSYLRPSVDPDVAGSVCSAQYYLIQPQSYLAQLGVAGAYMPDVAIHHVPAERLAYTAWADAGTIYVKKLTYGTNGQLDTSGMAVVSFAAATGATSVKNISLTATDDSLLIAYMSNDTPAPGSYKLRVRRINISNAASEGSKTAATFAASTRKFGYGTLSFTNSCGGTNCAWDSTARTVTFDGTVIAAAGVTINGVPISATVTQPTPTTSICSNCTDVGQATSLMNAINASTSTALQGITATIDAIDPIVTIHGLDTNVAYDGTSTMLTIGKIVSVGTSWYIPVVDAGAVGADQNKIFIYSGTATNLSSVTAPTTPLMTLGTASVISNELTPSNTILLGYITLSGSIARVIELDGSNAVSTTPLTLFSGAAMTDIKVKASPGATNPNVFVVAKNASGDYLLGRVPSSLASAGTQGLLSTYIDTTYSTNSTILSGVISDVDIQPALPLSPATISNEARLLVNSDSGTGDFNSYLFRWKQISGSPYEALDASQGLILEKAGVNTTSTTKFASAPIYSITMGDTSALAADKTNSALLFMKINTDAPAIPEFGLVNTEVETIHSTTREATGLFNPALVR